MLGYVYLSVKELREDKKIYFMNEKTQKLMKCFLMIHSFEIKETYKFIEYLCGGMNISFTTAIDFTASNKSPEDPNSLHYRDY